MAESTVRIDILGSLRVREPSGVELTRPSHRRLLSILALTSDVPVGRDLLIDRFWADEPPATARAALHTHISSLRRILGSDSIAFDARGYSLDPEIVHVDVVEFEEQWQAATNASRDRAWHDALQAARAARSMWRGDPFTELQDDWYAIADIARLIEMHLGLTELEGEALLQLGQPADALPALESFVIHHPERERGWELLMKAQYRMGRHADAVRAFRSASEHLAEIGLEPSERLRRLEDQILLHDRSLTPTPHNLSADLDTFFGRDDEQGRVRALVAAQRLVTLIGPGGAGKTRLAEQICKGLFDRFPGGIWMVELDPIDSVDLVHATIGSAMGLKPRDGAALPALMAALSGSPTLVVLDNCEHLLPEITRTVERLLVEVTDLTILATSREPTRARGEVVVEIVGLPVSANPDSEAIALFIDRAQARGPLALGDDGLGIVADLCERLDGLPLAIELAAARVATLGLPTIAGRIDEQLGYLTAGTTVHERHRTLEATIAWSYDLLSEDQRVVLTELSVFRGGFTLEAAEAVVGGVVPPASLLDLVPALVDKSLVRAIVDGAQVRYRMLETVRQFAWRQLVSADRIQEARSRHATWAASLADTLWPEVFAMQLTILERRLASEADNVQAALTFAVEHSPALSGPLSEVLAWHWFLTGQFARAVESAREGLGTTPGSARRPLILSIGARAAAYAEDIDLALDLSRQALAAVTSASPEERTWVLSTCQLCLVMSARTDPSRMLSVADDALSGTQVLGASASAALAYETAADGYCWNGLTAEGLSFQDEALRIARASNNPDLIDHVYGHAIYNLMLDPVSRGTRPGHHVDEWMALSGPHADGAVSVSTDWLPWIHMQRGDLVAAGQELRRIGHRKREGYNRTIFLLVAATVAWMGGQLTEAADSIAELERHGVNERWWHVFYPLAADIACDAGDTDRTRAIAGIYRDTTVHTTGEAAKLGALMAQVRAEVDAGVASGAPDALATARGILDDMQRLLAEHPPAAQASTALLTPTQNVVFATAELTRLEDPDPDAWIRARHNADYAYFRTYATLRLAEAMIDLGRRHDAVTHLSQAFGEASEMRFAHLARQAAKSAQRAGLNLERVESAPRSIGT